jgi:glutaredoxin 3
MPNDRKATLFRMVLPDHTCPFGVRAKQLLEQNGYNVDDKVLTSRDEVDSFKDQEGVTTTPVVFIGEQRIGGADELEQYLKG